MILKLNVFMLIFCSVNCNVPFTTRFKEMAKLVHDHVLHANTPENVEKLNHLEYDDLAEEFSGQYQGDIVISDEQIAEIESGRRIGQRADKYRWPDQTIPYKIEKLYYTRDQLAAIRTAMDKIEEVSCLKFVHYDKKKHEDYVRIIGEQAGCFSELGRKGGVQDANIHPDPLGSGCFRIYSIVHELLHVLGFFHMQSASDRDKFVKIQWPNIKKNLQGNFKKFSTDVLNDYEVPYDYDSVMHYTVKAFAIDKKQPTMVALKPLGKAKIGQRERLTEKDIRRINKMYCKDIENDEDS